MASIYDKASLVLIPSGTKTSKVYSQKPTNGDGDFTFSRSTAATRVNASGNIEKETQNLLTRSKSLNIISGGWGLSNATSDTAADFDGGNAANELTGTGFIYQPLTGFSGVHTFSVYVKAGTWEGVRIRIDIASNSPQAYFNLSTGVLYSGANYIDAQITDVGNDWYRITITGNVVSPNNLRIYPVDTTSVGGTGNIILYKAQGEQGLVARDYIETTTPVYGGITDNVPRLDYTDSSCPALLLEPLRTNKIASSEYFQSGWTFVGVTKTDNYGASPEGLQNSTRIVFSGANNYMNLPSGYTGGFEACTIYMKGTAGETIKFGKGLNVAQSDFHTLTGNWQRLTFIGEDRGTAYHISTYGGATARDIEIWGAQLEDGSYATSYIPTYGSAVTRNKDSFYDNSYQANNIFGADSGSIFFDFGDEFTLFDGVSNSSPVDIMQFVDITAYGGGYFRFRGGETNHYLQLVNMDAADTALTFSDQTKYCICWDSNGVDFYGDGALIDSTTIGIVPSINRIENGLSGTQRETRIERILFFTNKLSSQEAIDLTTI